MSRTSEFFLFLSRRIPSVSRQINAKISSCAKSVSLATKFALFSSICARCKPRVKPCAGHSIERIIAESRIKLESGTFTVYITRERKCAWVRESLISSLFHGGTWSVVIRSALPHWLEISISRLKHL